MSCGWLLASATHSPFFLLRSRLALIAVWARFTNLWSCKVHVGALGWVHLLWAAYELTCLEFLVSSLFFSLRYSSIVIG